MSVEYLNSFGWRFFRQLFSIFFLFKTNETTNWIQLNENANDEELNELIFVPMSASEVTFNFKHVVVVGPSRLVSSPRAA